MGDIVALVFDHAVCRPETLERVALAILREQVRDGHKESAELSRLAQWVSPTAYAKLTTKGCL